jgi:nucleobase:cation symporter-1, NCS1 family
MISLCVATLATNLAANVVSPANDFSHLAPRFINFRTGGLITGIIGILIQPWKLMADPSGYIFTWLVAYSALLGAVGGILIVDYFLIRRREPELAGLFKQSGPYWYLRQGFNPIARTYRADSRHRAVRARISRQSSALIHVAPDLDTDLYNYAWFISLGISGVVYALLML